MFAPINSAIQSLPANTIAQLQSNMTVTTEILQYHVTLQRLPTANFVNNALITTANPNGLMVRTNVYTVPGKGKFM